MLHTIYFLYNYVIYSKHMLYSSMLHTMYIYTVTVIVYAVGGCDANMLNVYNSLQKKSREWPGLK